MKAQSSEIPSMLYTEVLPICKPIFSLPASFFPKPVLFFCHFVFHLLSSHHAHLLSTPCDTCKCSRIHSCSRTLLVFLRCILFWFLFFAGLVWHSFHILMQNMLKGVYLKLQLFKHSKWSLWEGRGVKGMQTKATDDDLYVAHLPLYTKLFTALIWPVSGSEQLPTVA